MNRKASSNPGPVPERWIECPRKSDGFIANKFMAFKMPLDERFDAAIPVEATFTPELVLQSISLLKRRLGLWIDLTNTTRFYNKKYVENSGADYVKISSGYDDIPSRSQVKTFIEFVECFSRNHPDDVVGVHCTHGFNLTGFFIVCYLVEKMGYSVKFALETFASTRSPGIYKTDYVEELYRRYGKGNALPLQLTLPSWACMGKERNQTLRPIGQKRLSESSESSESSGYSGSSGMSQPSKKRKCEYFDPNARFMAGVPGVRLVKDQPRLSQLQALCHDMCGWTERGFPGSEPVSMHEGNLQLIREKPYHVSWKAVGTRYMMLILGEHQIFFFDRDFACFQVINMRFPRRSNLKDHLVNTLVDGVMVIDKVNGQDVPRYLICDVIRFENENMGQRTFDERILCIKDRIVGPRTEAIGKGIIRRRCEPFGIRPKDFWNIENTKELLGQRFRATLSHEWDGLIFQPSMSPYKFGNSEALLKWKPLELNSVDFRQKLVTSTSDDGLKYKIGHLYVRKQATPFGEIKFSDDLRGLDEKIIECRLKGSSWIFVRQRKDRSFPDSFTAAMDVYKSILCPVSEEMLLDSIT